MTRDKTSVRWTMVGLLTGMSFVSYVERMNISVAAQFMQPEFGIDKVQMGRVFSSFLLGYALFQIPAGRAGDVFGPRRVLTISAIVWGITTVLTGLLPGMLVSGTAAVLVLLMVLRFTLGIGEAATYPVAARTIANWMPDSQRGLAISIQTAGLSLGSAFTPPAISWLMVNLGWRQSFYIASSLAFLMAIIWWWYNRDYPQQHPGVSPAERALIEAGQVEQRAVKASSGNISWWTLFKNRNVLLVSAAYFVEGYVLFIFVFWLFTYLVEERHFSILGSGIYSALPFIVSAILTPIGGAWSDRLSSRIGRRWGRRIPAMVGFTISAVTLWYGVVVENPMLAIAALALSVGFVEFTEGTFWATAVDVAGPHSGASTGILNTVGNLGGVVSTALVPILVKHFGWPVALSSGSVLALVSAGLWLMIRADEPFGGPVPARVEPVPVRS